MAAILNRQHILCLEEEPTYGNRAATPFTNPVYLMPIAGSILETPNIVKLDVADGSRWNSRKLITAKTVTWALNLEVHPLLMGWFLKWGLGTRIVVDQTTGHYRFVPCAVNVELPSVSIYVDVQKEDYWAAGQQTILLVGCKIARLRLDGSGVDEDRRVLMTVEGVGQKVVGDMLLDYDAQTVAFAADRILTGGTSGATALIVSDNDLGAYGTLTLRDVRGTFQDGETITAAGGGSAAVDGEAYIIPTADTLRALAPLRYARTLLYNSVAATPFMFKNLVPNVAAGGYLGSNNWKRFGFEVLNTLIPKTYSKGTTTLTIDDLKLATQLFTAGFDKDFIDAVTQIHDFRSATDRAIDLRLTHSASRNESSPIRYQADIHLLRHNTDDMGNLVEFGGGEDESMRTFSGEALRKETVTDVTNTATGTDHDLAISTALVLGTSGDAEAWEFTTTAGGYCTGGKVDLKVSTVAAEDIVFCLLTDDGGGTSEPTPGAAGLVPGGVSNTISGEMLLTTHQSIYFTFPNAPKLDAATVYWLAIYTTANGSTNIDIRGDLVGGQHSITTDGGVSWGVPDADDWQVDLYFDEIPVAVDLYVDDDATYYPDAT